MGDESSVPCRLNWARWQHTARARSAGLIFDSAPTRCVSGRPSSRHTFTAINHPRDGPARPERTGRPGQPRGRANRFSGAAATAMNRLEPRGVATERAARTRGGQRTMLFGAAPWDGRRWFARHNTTCIRPRRNTAGASPQVPRAETLGRPEACSQLIDTARRDN